MDVRVLGRAAQEQDEPAREQQAGKEGSGRDEGAGHRHVRSPSRLSAGFRDPPYTNGGPHGCRCESASNLDPTPIEHQVVEADPELFISGGFDQRPTVPPLFSRKSLECNALQRFRQGSKLDADSQLLYDSRC